MAEEDYRKCWREISTCGLPKMREESANGEVPLWEEVQAKLNLQLRSLCIKGRSGHQSYVIDDHKCHVEADPAKHKNLLAKFIKHTADNRWGMTIDSQRSGTCAKCAHITGRQRRAPIAPSAITGFILALALFLTTRRS